MLDRKMRVKNCLKSFVNFLYIDLSNECDCAHHGKPHPLSLESLGVNRCIWYSVKILIKIGCVGTQNKLKILIENYDWVVNILMGLILILWIMPWSETGKILTKLNIVNRSNFLHVQIQSVLQFWVWCDPKEAGTNLNNLNSVNPYFKI